MAKRALSSSGVQMFLGVDAEAAVPCRRGKRCELRVAHMHQRRVIAALEINLRLLFDAVVDNGIETVAFANWRNGAWHAVIEQLFDFVLGCQINVQAELHSEVLQANVVRCRQYGQDIAILVAKHDGFGNPVAGDPAGLGVRIDDLVGSCATTS